LIEQRYKSISPGKEETVQMNFDITILAGPLIGAVIGYFTNYIAVKMLFRPLHPVYLGKWKLPFTPGIIPKGQARLAKAIGKAVGNVLLTKEDMEKLLLSQKAQDMVKNQVHHLYQIGMENTDSLQDSVGKIVNPDAVEHFIAKATDTVSNLIYKKMMEMNLGNLVGEKVAEIVRQKAQGTLFAMMLNDKLIAGIQRIIEEELNQYLKEHGEELIQKKTEEGMHSFASKSVSELVGSLPFTEQELEQAVSSVYKKLITDYFGSLMEHIPISRIVEDKINTMDVKEVEDLALSVMKKELNSIVNLGALIGLIIGCVNILF